VEPDELDQPHDLGLRLAKAKLASTRAQAPCDRGEVEHQRRVGEHEAAEVDDHILLRLDRSRQSATARPLGRAILIAAAAEDA
jgi:hypothetical protein